MRVRELLVKSLRGAADFNQANQVAPACILWPDQDRQWESVVEQLQKDMPELLVLGDFAPDRHTGPAIWIRCKLPEIAEQTPVVYLPGVSRQDLRAVESCPDLLKTLVELQYRGTIWSQYNGKDWTVLAYLRSAQGGLSLDVAQDAETKQAVKLALSVLLGEDIRGLKGRRLDAEFFHTLTVGGDPVRDVLRWLDGDEEYRLSLGNNQWEAFLGVCQSQFGFNPEREGVLTGAENLARRMAPWASVFQRYCEAPTLYPNIPDRIRRLPMPAPNDLFPGTECYIGWPQWNDQQETALRQGLSSLDQCTVRDARRKLKEFEKQHRDRRDWVWAQLGMAPLARAMEYLAVLSEVTESELTAGTIAELEAAYCQRGWKADDAVNRALSLIDTETDLQPVATAIRAVYAPWAEEAARHLQKVVSTTEYPGGDRFKVEPVTLTHGECMLFVDGLRFDAGKRLSEMLVQAGLEVQETPHWNALPSVTWTGKPAVAPIDRGSDRIAKEADVQHFEALKPHHFRKAIEASGTQFLSAEHKFEAPGKGWCEYGNIDSEGHSGGCKLASRLDGLLREVRDRIQLLLQEGWKTVRVVTDHGWLLLPGGLPKTTLPSVLSESKWGRCAILKPGAASEERVYPWYWDPNRYFALADGISCYKKGEEYAHGGLSLQECLTLQLRVTAAASGSGNAGIQISSIQWNGYWCKVTTRGSGVEGVLLDVRLMPGDEGTSLVKAKKSLDGQGTAKVMVVGDDLEGRDVYVVLVNQDNSLVAQFATIVGGEAS
jgi:hypothetical protein